MSASVNATEELKAVYNELIQDCERAETTRGQSDDQYSRRASIRSVFAMIEGLTFMMKKVVLVALEEVPGAYDKLAFSLAELALLREEAYSLKDNGSARTSTAYLRLLPNLRFAVTSYARIWTSDFKPDCSGKGWQALTRAAELRNRITHPKSSEEVHVSDEDMAEFIEGATWHRETMENLLNECDRKSRELENG